MYTDGANFDSNPRLARYLFQLLRHGVYVCVVTAAGYEYNVEKYEYRLSGLLNYFKQQGLTPEECERFVLFGGECNYLVHVSAQPVESDVQPVQCVNRMEISHQLATFLTVAGKRLPSSPSERAWTRWMAHCYEVPA